MTYKGKKVYDPITDTWSTGDWVHDNRGNWYPVWRPCHIENKEPKDWGQFIESEDKE